MTTVCTTDLNGALLARPAAEASETGSWIAVSGPNDAELDTLAETYQLDRDHLADAVDIYEAPRIEKYEGKVYIYTRFCYPEGKEIATEPLLLIHSPDHLISVMRTETTLLNNFINGRVEVNTRQKTHLLMQIMEQIDNSYQLQLNKVSKQILRIRAQLRQSQISNREFVGIIEIEEDLNEFLAALQPQASMLTSLSTSKYLRFQEEDRELIEDLTLETRELIELTKSRLRTLMNIRQAYDAIATNNLNNTFKRLTSIAIFLTIPTIIGGLWGMNVAVPFHSYPHAFLLVLAIIAGLMALTVWFFNTKKWF